MQNKTVYILTCSCLHENTQNVLFALLITALARFYRTLYDVCKYLMISSLWTMYTPTIDMLSYLSRRCVNYGEGIGVHSPVSFLYWNTFPREFCFLREYTDKTPCPLMTFDPHYIEAPWGWPLGPTPSKGGSGSKLCLRWSNWVSVVESHSTPSPRRQNPAYTSDVQ